MQAVVDASPLYPHDWPNKPDSKRCAARSVGDPCSWMSQMMNSRATACGRPSLTSELAVDTVVRVANDSVDPAASS